jgi:hypothetical protein
VTVSLHLADAFDNPVTNLTAAALKIAGVVTGLQTVPGPNLTAAAGPGNWLYQMTFAAIQNVTFSLQIDGALARGPFAFPRAGAAERAVDLGASLRAAALQADGAAPAAPRSQLSAGGAITANAWHVVHIPIVRILPPALGPFVADPGLSATLKIQALNGTSGAPDASRPPLLFTGAWSWTNGSYVVPLRLAVDAAKSNTTFAATLSLAYPSGVQVRWGSAQAWEGCAASQPCLQHAVRCRRKLIRTLASFAAQQGFGAKALQLAVG